MISEFVSEEFRQVAGACQDAVDNATDFDAWVPPGSPGGTTYSNQFVDMKTGVSTDKKSGTKSAWVALDFCIVDGDYAGQKWTKGFTTKYPNSLGGLFRFASMVTNDPSHAANRNFREAVSAISDHVGEPIVNIIVKIDVNTKTQTEYTKYIFDKVVDCVVETPAVEAV